jgi:hypothetical protein
MMALTVTGEQIGLTDSVMVERNLLWKILRNAAGTVLNITQGAAAVEGKQRIAFAQI